MVLPNDLTQEEYDRALEFAKLVSKTYDWDDTNLANFGLDLYSGIEDIKKQDFRTPNYTRIRAGGDSIDWWGGDDHGLDYVVFQHKESKDLVVAFRGTEPLSLEDWKEDVEQAITGSSKQYEEAVKLAKRISETSPRDRNVYFIGHSLGGGLATAAALATGRKAIVFCAAGLSVTTIRALELDPRNESFVTNFNVRECFVSDWNKEMDITTAPIGVCRQYGKQFWLESVSERADFKLLPDWSNIVKMAETILNHAWHVFTYQLEHQNFADDNARPTKRMKL